jgi:hypothetical protein
VNDLDDALAATTPEPVTSVSTVLPRPCDRHQWVERAAVLGEPVATYCRRCGKAKDAERSRRSRNNGKRGRAAELTAAREVGGRKVGPMGWPWDVEMPGYARLQVKKLATPPSLRSIAGWLADIARTPGQEMPGVIWLEPGRGGERLIVFRLRDFADRHGVPDEEAA